MDNKRYLNTALCLLLLLSISCQVLPSKPVAVPQNTTPMQTAHVRRLGTPPYTGGGAVIFVLDRIGKSNPKNVTDRIISLFGQNNAPLTVALAPASNNSDYSDVSYLRSYADAGLLDISVDGYSSSWLPTDLPLQTVRKWPEYSALTDSLIKSRGQIKYFFGEDPFTCLIPAASLDQVNYTAMQDAGFRVLCSSDSSQLHPSVQPTAWSGQPDNKGLYRLPMVGTFSTTPGANSQLLSAVGQSVDKMGVAIIEIQPGAVVGKQNEIDEVKLAQLAELVRSCGQLGEITTIENWYQYRIGCPDNATGRQPILPPYDGGYAVIFRVDDVAKGWHEDVVREIIGVFSSNGVPVDLGIISNASGTESYEIPWLKQYVDQGTVGINVHGYDWTGYQLDITRSYLSHIKDNPCINYATEQAEEEKAKLTYIDVKSKLAQARCKYLKYFGVNPVAFTVPTDFYDEAGFKAIREAGYKVISAHIIIEPCRSTEPADFICRSDPNGLFRIPTASDVCDWENCNWGDVHDVSRMAKIADFCKNHEIWADTFTDDLSTNLCLLLNSIGVAAISIHPQAFIDKDGKPNNAKLAKLDSIIKWCKSFTTIMTFEQWYVYKTGRK